MVNIRLVKNTLIATVLSILPSLLYVSDKNVSNQEKAYEKAMKDNERQ